MKDILLKRSFLSRFADGLDEVELEQPDYVTVLKVVWFSIRSFFVERPGRSLARHSC